MGPIKKEVSNIPVADTDKTTIYETKTNEYVVSKIIEPNKNKL